MVTQTKPAPHVTRNSGNNEWYTPSPIIDAARRAMGSIDCDPATCEAANRWIKATTIYTAETDGLANQWHGNVWLNPPYSRDLLPKFVDAVIDRYLDSQIDQAIVLVNNATDTAAAQKLLYFSSAVCFFRGRIAFWDETGTPARKPLQGQMAVYIGARWSRFLKEFGPLGAAWGGGPLG